MKEDGVLRSKTLKREWSHAGFGREGGVGRTSKIKNYTKVETY